MFWFDFKKCVKTSVLDLATNIFLTGPLVPDAKLVWRLQPDSIVIVWWCSTILTWALLTQRSRWYWITTPYLTIMQQVYFTSFSISHSLIISHQQQKLNWVYNDQNTLHGIAWFKLGGNDRSVRMLSTTSHLTQQPQLPQRHLLAPLFQVKFPWSRYIARHSFFYCNN